MIFVTLGLKFFARGMLSISAVLLGLLAGYAVAFALGMVSFGNVGRAAPFALPNPLHFGLEFTAAAIIGFCAMAFVSAVETVGDVSGIAKGGAGREATDREIRGATYADGLGTAVSGLFGALPNTSFSQNVGLIAMTGVMSRHVVTIGRCALVVAGLFPKVGAVISTVPIEVLGGGVIVMFGMVVAAGISMLSDVHWNRRNMVIFAIALSLGLGLQLEPIGAATPARHAARAADHRHPAGRVHRHHPEPGPAAGPGRRGDGRGLWRAARRRARGWTLADRKRLTLAALGRAQG